MHTIISQQILSQLEDDINKAPPLHITPLIVDKWLAASLLQKAIRRNAIAHATQAAVSLWRQDSKKFWIRCCLIAAEDCGAGDTDTVIKVLTAVASSAWRKCMGDERVAIHLTRLLCLSAKNRMADELFIHVQHDPKHKPLQEKFSHAKDDLLAGYVADEDGALVERSLALWYLFGTKKYPSDVMPGRVGSPEMAMKVLRGLNAPIGLMDACIAVMNKTPYPLHIFMPLIWQTVYKQRLHLRIVSNVIPTVPEVGGVPIYAADMFTRSGLASIRQFQKSVPELQSFSVKQVGLSLFYADGGRVDRLLTSDALEKFRQQGELLDLLSAGLHPPEYMRLRECVTANMQTLNDIRHARLQQYLLGGDL